MTSFRRLLGALARPGSWSTAAWGVLVMIGLCAVVTVLIGVQLYQITEQPPGFNTQ